MKFCENVENVIGKLKIDPNSSESKSVLSLNKWIVMLSLIKTFVEFNKIQFIDILSDSNTHL